MKARFELFQGVSGDWFFNLRATNGKIICQSEGYKQKKSAKKGIAAIKRLAGKAGIEEITKLNVRK